MTDPKFQAAVDMAIAALTPDEAADLKAHGTESAVFARLVREGDPVWAMAVAAHLN